MGIAARAELNDAAFRLAIGVTALGLCAIVARVSFCHEVLLPPVPPPPAPRADVVTVAAVSASVDLDPSMYAEKLASDSRDLKIEPEVTPEDLSGVFEHRVDSRRRTLEPRKKRSSAEALGLELSLSVADVEGTPRRQLVLTIENTTSHHLAYRVMTRTSRGARSCYAKGDLAHNAVALAPGEKARRSECIHRKGLKLFVDRVETIRLPRLSYFYVSALPATALGLDGASRLAARGHRPKSAARSPCRVFHSAEILAGVSSGATTWRDLVDFYARHPCGVYSFPINYKAFEGDGERPLPAVPPAE